MSIGATVIEEAPSATKERLLDVAERLFADQGFDVVSLRAITTEAEANLAAVHYHFGSKDALIAAVVGRHLAPINRRRLEQLDAAPRPLSIAGVVSAFVDPVLEAVRAGGGTDGYFCRLMARCMAQRDERISQALVELFGAVVVRFSDALVECCPGLEPGVAHLRLLFMGGTLSQTLFHLDLMERVCAERCELPDFDRLRAEMVAFLIAGNGATIGGGGK